jgi:hypothetical protein
MELTVKLLERGSSARIPLFFSLRDYQHVETLQSIVTKGLMENYGIVNFSYPAFLRLLEEGGCCRSSTRSTSLPRCRNAGRPWVACGA